MTDFSISLLVFWAFGFALMFGTSRAGWIGSSHFFLPMDQESFDLTTTFLFQAMFCATAATIISGAVAGRMRFAAYIITTLIVSGLIYPVFGHWAWGGTLEGEPGWLAARGFVDFAGSSVVHSVGGLAAFAAILVIGPRIDRFEKKRSSKEIPGNNLPLAMLGTMLLWMGWIGFNGGSTLAMNEQVAGVIGNTFLAGTAGMLTALTVFWLIRGYTEVNSAIKGSLAGLVAITASCHAVNAPSAIIIGSFGAIVMMSTQWLLDRYKIDDAIGAVPVHAAAGIWGTIAVALFGVPELLGTGLSRWAQFQVQLIGIFVVSAVAFGTTFVLLWLIHQVFSLRVTPEQERVGLNIAEHGASTDLLELLNEMEMQRHLGDFSNKVTVEPGSDIGQIAAQYNRVLDKVTCETNKAIQTAETAELSKQQVEQASAKLKRSEVRLRSILETASEGIVTIDSRGIIESFNEAATKMFGYREEETVGQNVSMLMPSPDAEQHDQYITNYLQGGRAKVIDARREVQGKRKNGTLFPMELAVSEVYLINTHLFTATIRDLTEHKQLQCELTQAQKLESVGQLAAGIAHEINTPTQYVGDNTQFLKEAFGDLNHVLDKFEKLLQATKDNSVDEQLMKEVEEALEQADITYLRKEIPQAIDQSLDGVQRVAKIVRAMKEFSHPGGGEEKSLVDLKEALQTTITVACNEWKYVAEVMTEFDPELPQVSCLPGELNQVFLNLIVNAAHAISDTLSDETTQKGIITIGTRRDGEWAEIFIRDTGTGIPEEIRSRIFDPFFTTKEVGKGTGQGLAIARSVVVDKHDGTINCETEQGKGTTFIIRLPINGQE